MNIAQLAQAAHEINKLYRNDGEKYWHELTDDERKEAVKRVELSFYSPDAPIDPDGEDYYIKSVIRILVKFLI